MLLWRNTTSIITEETLKARLARPKLDQADSKKSILTITLHNPTAYGTLYCCCHVRWSTLVSHPAWFPNASPASDDRFGSNRPGSYLLPLAEIAPVPKLTSRWDCAVVVPLGELFEKPLERSEQLGRGGGELDRGCQTGYQTTKEAKRIYHITRSKVRQHFLSELKIMLICEKQNYMVQATTIAGF